MEENENGETEVISTTDLRFTPREVLGGAFAIPGAPKPFLIEDDGQIIERVIHHINTRFSATIDVYFQEVYTDMIAEGIPQNLNHYIGKNVRVQFYSNGVLESVQMSTGTITINSEMDDVWRFAFDHFFTNEQVENDDTLVLKMEYESNNIPSLGYDGTLNVHYDTLIGTKLSWNSSVMSVIRILMDTTLRQLITTKGARNTQGMETNR